MYWEILGSLALGTAVSWSALRRLPHRFPHHRHLTLATGPVSALTGALLVQAVLGAPDGRPLASLASVATLAGALVMTVALLSLLFRPGPAGLRPRAAPERRPAVSPRLG
ncbi:hypothetical protein [Streptomyces aidingensis]|uniref:Uncharacterized protein n=1 Tax=Streptomyces aidingensis TaxID=910347 RepID=A0A1I1F0B5_9ACTN|nr:hypothetical protein [Streptomyces aidingensis]SFB91198.1 hypothetical protein SAMN05421773_101489 [Streptomyces aidingensis]